VCTRAYSIFTGREISWRRSGRGSRSTLREQLRVASRSRGAGHEARVRCRGNLAASPAVVLGRCLCVAVRLTSTWRGRNAERESEAHHHQMQRNGCGAQSNAQGKARSRALSGKAPAPPALPAPPRAAKDTPHAWQATIASSRTQWAANKRPPSGEETGRTFSLNLQFNKGET